MYAALVLCPYCLYIHPTARRCVADFDEPGGEVVAGRFGGHPSNIHFEPPVHSTHFDETIMEPDEPAHIIKPTRRDAAVAAAVTETDVAPLYKGEGPLPVPSAPPPPYY